MRVPFIVYADFESFTPQLSTCQPNPKMSYTKQYQKYTPSEFCHHMKCFDDTLYSQEPVTFVKEFNNEVAQIFMDTLEKNIKEIYKMFKFPKILIMSMHDKMFYDNSTLCHICNEELDEDRVRDHCHLSSKFRGAAHEVCNLKYKVPKLYFTISLTMIVTYLLEHCAIAKEIFFEYQVMKKTTFLSRNRS